MPKPTDFTHKGLLKAGYTHHNPDPIRGEGFVVYYLGAGSKAGWFGPYAQVCFAGNNAVMTGRAEEIWKRMYPRLYAWWVDPKRRDPYDWEHTFIFIKGEDPALMEEPHVGP